MGNCMKPLLVKTVSIDRTELTASVISPHAVHGLVRQFLSFILEPANCKEYDTIEIYVFHDFLRWK